MEKTLTAPPRLLASLAFCALALGAAPARAATLHVSPSGSDNNVGTAASPYATVQAAINNANAGDIIALGAGTYVGLGNRDIDFGGKALTVRSDGGAAVTVIDCGGSQAENHRGFHFRGKQAGARVEGLTLKNSYPAGDGGAAFVERGSEAAFKGCAFTGNDSTLHIAGGVLNEGKVTVTACNFTGNPASGLMNRGTATVTGCTFKGNRAADAAGDGAGINTFGPLTLTDCAFTDNTAAGASAAGGGLSAAGGGIVTATRCTFTGNRARIGGGVNGGAVTLADCTFLGNRADSGGGGLCLSSGSTAAADRCVFRDNQALAGGGILVGHYFSLTLTNCALIGNAATDGNGGGVSSYGTLTLRFCSLGGNSARGAGDQGRIRRGIAVASVSVVAGRVPQGGALESDGKTVLTDCIVWGNDAPYEAGLGASTTDGSMTIATHCDIQGGLSGAGNLKADPRFAGPADLHLQPGSPCRGVGVALPGVTTDAGGKHRPSLPSLGAYQ